MEKRNIGFIISQAISNNNTGIYSHKQLEISLNDSIKKIIISYLSDIYTPSADYFGCFNIVMCPSKVLASQILRSVKKINSEEKKIIEANGMVLRLKNSDKNITPMIVSLLPLDDQTEIAKIERHKEALLETDPTSFQSNRNCFDLELSYNISRIILKDIFIPLYFPLSNGVAIAELAPAHLKPHEDIKTSYKIALKLAVFGYTIKDLIPNIQKTKSGKLALVDPEELNKISVDEKEFLQPINMLDTKTLEFNGHLSKIVQINLLKSFRKKLSQDSNEIKNIKNNYKFGQFIYNLVIENLFNPNTNDDYRYQMEAIRVINEKDSIQLLSKEYNNVIDFILKLSFLIRIMKDEEENILIMSKDILLKIAIKPRKTFLIQIAKIIQTFDHEEKESANKQHNDDWDLITNPLNATLSKSKCMKILLIYWTYGMNGNKEMSFIEKHFNKLIEYIHCRNLNPPTIDKIMAWESNDKIMALLH